MVNDKTVNLVLNYPKENNVSVTGTQIFAFIAHPASQGTITSFTNQANPADKPIADGGFTQNLMGTFSYSGTNYKVYRIGTSAQAVGTTVTYRVT